MGPQFDVVGFLTCILKGSVTGLEDCFYKVSDSVDIYKPDPEIKLMYSNVIKKGVS